LFCRKSNSSVGRRSRSGIALTVRNVTVPVTPRCTCTKLSGSRRESPSRLRECPRPRNSGSLPPLPGHWGLGGMMFTNRSLPVNVFARAGTMAGARGSWRAPPAPGNGRHGLAFAEAGRQCGARANQERDQDSESGLFEGIIRLTGSAAVAHAGHGAALKALPGSWAPPALASRLSQLASSGRRKGAKPGARRRIGRVAPAEAVRHRPRRGRGRSGAPRLAGLRGGAWRGRCARRRTERACRRGWGRCARRRRDRRALLDLKGQGFLVAALAQRDLVVAPPLPGDAVHLLALLHPVHAPVRFLAQERDRKSPARSPLAA
jgi:hypothetical protein